MAKKYTKHIRMGKYEITSHAQNRIVDKSRNLTKNDMLVNLFGKSKNSKFYKYKDGTIQYDRINDKNRTITHITKNHNVKTIQKYHNNKKNKEKAYKNFQEVYLCFLRRNKKKLKNLLLANSQYFL